MPVQFLFVMRKLLAWLFALLSALLPHHLLLQLPESERCLAPHEALVAELAAPVPAPMQGNAGPPVTDALVTAPEKR